MTTRPRLMVMVDVDDLPRERWPLDGSAVIILRGKLFKIEPVGCVLCVELEGNDHVTLCHTDEHGAENFICLTHGELTAVEYRMLKIYKITIGPVEREGEEELEDVMLFPNEMTLVARNELINRLLDEAAKTEEEDGPAPSAE